MVLGASLSASAQACNKAAAGKSCCASKKTASVDNGTTQVASVVMEADVIASTNPNIQKRTCEKSGSVSYYEKSVCEHSGSISWDEVKFDEGSKSFTRVASASMEKDSDAPASGKACAGQKDTKACCKNKTGAKACAGQKAGAQ